MKRDNHSAGSSPTFTRSLTFLHASPALKFLTALALTLALLPAQAKMQIASGGIARCVIVTQPGATPAERTAAEELSSMLKQITGATFETRELTDSVPESAIIVGSGPLVVKLFPEVDLSKFGGEEYAIRTQDGRLLLAGGRPRGTLYAVYRFLQDELGVRYYAPWFTHIPKRSSLSLGRLNSRGKPAFEYRDPFWFPAFDGDWAARNGSTSATARLKEKHGGQMIYKGFVHTFYPLVPPAQNFKTHPEWFSLVKGKRVSEGAQLCTTDPQLRDFIVDRVKAWLRESPDANIISVSQNDHAGACECERCAAVDEREGTHAGSLLELVNYVAEKIEPEFPNVLVDTLAYQYTRKAPKTLRPRRNVIIRLCSIECNFAKPLTDPSNELFARDIRDWHRLTDRLYIWDYTTDFSHYLLPFPNYYVVGPNVRFFHRNGVVGLFEQGAYQSSSGEMSELRAWVLAQLLWNPYQDDHKLVREFVEAYYGKPSARFILQHLDLISKAAQPYYVGIGHPDASPYLRFPTLVKAEQLWQQAEDAARGNPDHVWRVRQARLPISYLWLSQWTGLQRECRELGAKWPINPSRKAYAAQWIATVNEPGPVGWTPMTLMREAGQKPADFAAEVGSDPDESLYEPAKRHASLALPDDLPAEDRNRAISVQDDRAIIFREADRARPAADSAASDGVAIRMTAGPGGTRGAMEIHGGKLPASFKPGRYKVYYVVRIEAADGAKPDAAAFSARVHDGPLGKYISERLIKVSETAAGYHSYLVGTMELSSYSRLWMGHPNNEAVKSVWLDRAILVPVK
ncbi:MAG: DUF4838 domain-containing protein [Verrucomicrobia bacterium]|nr:DUF4838 domain-containing protein [Verrucomicrobiota bacterium]